MPDQADSETTSKISDAPIQSLPSQVLSEAPLDRGEIPFLVTHWLANYEGDPAIVNRIRHAAAALASAFSDAGVFGSVSQTSFSTPGLARHTNPSTRLSTFTDMRRRWGSSCPPDQLERLLQSSIATDIAFGSSVVNSPNLLMLGREKRSQLIKNPTTGRTLQDAIDVENEGRIQSAMDNQTSISVLHRPALLAAGKPDRPDSEAASESMESHKLNVMSVFEVTAKHASKSSHSFLELKDQCKGRADQFRRLKRSLDHQKKVLAEFEGDHFPVCEQISGSDGLLVAEVRAREEREENVQNCNRVIAQLNRQLLTMDEQLKSDRNELRRAEADSHSTYVAFARTIKKYRDPFTTSRQCSSNGVLENVMFRQIGLCPPGIGQHRLSRGLLGNALSTSGMRRNLVHTRFSHGATINTHLSYPIYCLRFDRTGRYFITGADDYLAKVYCLGANVNAQGHTIEKELYIRGAVLVCTLRGHAGVINDINVSSDNAFLATASEDGDCRVWGLKDGTPIAILRGHTGGANMVSWSDLTPYRLITASSDGYARVWDVKEACLRRYKYVVGKRKDYSSHKTLVLRCQATRKISNDSEGRFTRVGLQTAEDGAGVTTKPEEYLELEDAAERPEMTSGSDVHTPSNAALPENLIAPVPLPPLPPPVAPTGQEPTVPVPLPPLPLPIGNTVQEHPHLHPHAPGAIGPGRFVPGDSIDRGVKLLAKLQHGASRDESMVGPGTRSRRAAMKVLCVAVCPTGGHFTTGADDGICRVYSADDDEAIGLADFQATVRAGFSSAKGHKRWNGPSRLLQTLKGHLSAITDLQYSFNGDRILSASQKDGVVRIWLSPHDAGGTNQVTGHTAASPSVRSGPSQIVIKLTNPDSCRTEEQATASRRRPARTSGSNVSCDVAAWLRGDKCIITSQCELTKPTSNEIIPGSQYLFIWDSHSGQCLLGIVGAHSMQCAVVIPHPTEPSLVCSAGADGKVRLWNVESGKCVLTHQNTVDFGPIEARDRGQISAYLDGSFSPDGLNLVLTDDGGRVTVLNCANPHLDPSTNPIWMKEQYFANDYYELLYDPDGYCIERGSEEPPHLAPRGVRCSHSGAPSGELVNNAFKSLVGPLPLSEHNVLWDRVKRRAGADLLLQKHVKRGNIVGQFDLAYTMLVSATGERIGGSGVAAERPVASEPVLSRASPQLSRNWRWRDYSDVLMEERLNNNEEEQPDSDDDSFQLETNNRKTDEKDGSDSDMGADREEPEESPAPGKQPSRNRRTRYMGGEGSSDEELVEFMSSNNTPSGPFVSDYDSHYFKISNSNRVNNRWLLRHESTSSYNGSKSYAPQVGDSIVYIPRAHHETITNFPSLVPPWQSWPDEAEWPVVRCLIRYIRYRFPFKAYFPRKNTGQKVCNSVVAILSLELTGIPELAGDHHWPKPSFISPAKSHTFEVGLFESDETDFVIPLSLYVSRLSSLERALSREHNPRVEASYANASGEDGFLEFFSGRVENVVDEDSLSNPTLRGSGYQSVEVAWDVVEGDSTRDFMSPWELRVKSEAANNENDRAQMSEDEKQKVRDALRLIQEMERVRECFLYPVDTRKYSDYFTRVEVPMYLEFVKNRLESNYYSNLLSVIADIKQIRDNSAKYNGDFDDLTELGSRMLEKFSRLVLTSKEYDDHIRNQQQVESCALEGRTYHEGNEVIQTDKERAHAAPVSRRQKGAGRPGRPEHPLAVAKQGVAAMRRSQRTRTNTSSLETLPPPMRLRIRLRQGSSNSRADRNGSEASPSVTEPAPVPVVALDGGTRGRTTRNPRVQQPLRSQVRSIVNSNDSQRTSAETTASVNDGRMPSRFQASSRSLRSNTNDGVNGVRGRNRDIRENSTRSAVLASARRTSPRSETRGSVDHPDTNDLKAEGNESDFKDDESSEPDDSDAMSNSSADQSLRSDKGDDIVQRRTQGSPVRRSTRFKRSQLESDGSSSSLNKNGRGYQHIENERSSERRTTRAASRANNTTARRSGAVDESEESSQHSSSLNKNGRGYQHIENERSSERRTTRAASRTNTTTARRSGAVDESEESSQHSDTGESTAFSKVKGKGRKSGTNSSNKRSSRQGNGRRVGENASARRAATRFQRKVRLDESGDDDDSNPSLDEHSAGPESRRTSRLRSANRADAGSGGTSVTVSGRRALARRADLSVPQENKRSRGIKKDQSIPVEREEHQNLRRGNRLTSAKSYLVPSSSDFSSDDGSDSAEGNEVPVGATSKRKKKPSSAKPPPKKQKHSHDENLPASKEWPDVGLKNITMITQEILDELKNHDVQGAFRIPVAEEFPAIADTYAETIDEPMDFRTIEEERLPNYQSINELQNDLKLVFINCIRFNRNNSPLSSLARDLLTRLDDIFRDVCKRKSILLPRRW
ncbi:hypothetical protein ACA910_016626 [Epithemia clementina (nom. ined.)]